MEKQKRKQLDQLPNQSNSKPSLLCQ
ncbi:hypothetical protein RDI58_030204 [Solanum bulbocastanum]|uniref:Uncharacterized protein n=1 Tax=Solanum bulbocastanum TaxID=147425 RepID=A0AAN8XY41_SOLBU